MKIEAKLFQAHYIRNNQGMRICYHHACHGKAQNKEDNRNIMSF